MLLLWSPALVAQDRAEKLNYEITWGLNDVATMTIDNACPRARYTASALTARSQGAAEQIHSFRIRFDSFAPRLGEFPFEGRTTITEEGKPRSFKTRFDQKKGKFEVTKEIENRTSGLKVKLGKPTHDMLSWLAELRSRKLEAGQRHDFWVWDGWKLSRVSATVGKIERIWTPLGTYRAHRLDITRTRLHHSGPTTYQKKRETREIGQMWLAVDPGHLPVAMDFDAPVGTAKIRLTRAVYGACSD